MTTRPSSPLLPTDPLPIAPGAARIENFGVILAEGTDAAQFLQGQLSQDLLLMKPHQVRLAAYCSPKGRMLASFIAVQLRTDAFLLLCSHDLLAATLKRLSMYVLRAKLHLSDATPDWQIWGLVGDALANIGPTAPAAMEKQEVGNALFLGLPPVLDTARALYLAPRSDATPAWTHTQTAPLWDWLDLRSGVARITTSLVDALVPQMLNYESVGGVNFKKGCYPGQEVVARSQFRGTIKRRAAIAYSATPLQAGQDIYQDGDTEQPCGVVVQVAAHPTAGWDAIVSAQTTALEHGGLCLGDGAALALRPLPYPLLQEI